MYKVSGIRHYVLGTRYQAPGIRLTRYQISIIVTKYHVFVSWFLVCVYSDILVILSDEHNGVAPGSRYQASGI